jgi:hypothetical protein
MKRLLIAMVLCAACAEESPLTHDAAGHEAAPADAGSAIELRAESLLCSVAQMQNWVHNNYPPSYGWSDSFSGNNATAHLVTGYCAGGTEYTERQFRAGSCSSSSCVYSVWNCNGSCAVGGCSSISFTLTCRCGDVNGCQVTR